MGYKKLKATKNIKFQFIVISAFVLLGIMSLMNELLDLPHLFFGVPSTPINWAEIAIEIVILFVIGSAAIYILCLLESKRKRAEETLREEEERFRTIFENTAIGMYRTTSYGQILMANSALVRMLGYSSFEELSQRNLEEEGFAPEYPRSVFKQCIESEDQIVGLESAWVKRDGTVIFIRESARLIRDDAGNILYYEGTVEDITERKQAEEALRDSEAKYRTLMESIRDGVYTLDTEGRFTFVNDVIVERCGQTTEWFIGKSYLDVIRPEDRERVEKNFHAVMGGEAVPIYELAYPTTSGDELWVEVNTTLLSDGGQINGLLGVARNITERKRTEEALRRSEQQYRAIFGNTGTATVILEEDTIISLANTEFENLSGYLREEIEGNKSWTEFVVKEDLQKMKEYHKARRIEPSSAPSNYEFRFIDRNGNVKNIFLTIAMIPGTKRSVASLLDITERKRMEEKLHYRVEMEDLIATISTNFINLNLDEIDIGINHALQTIGEFADVDRSYVFLISENGTKMDNTHEWCAEGIEPQIKNLKGLSVEVFPWWMEKLNQFETIYVPRVADLASEASAEREILQAQDIQSLVVVPMVYGKSLVGFLGFDSVRMGKTWVDEDISLLKMLAEIFVNALERKRAEEEKEQLQSQLLHAQKMEAIGTLAGGVAHDFNNLLTAIQGNAGLAMTRIDESDPVYEDLNQIQLTAESAAALTRQLLVFGRQQPLQPKSLNINSTVDDLLNILKPLISETIAIHTDLEPELWTVQADAANIEQVIMNLALNARDAMPKGGKLVTKTENVTLDEDYC